jgi:hypothetical protein
MSNPTWGQKRDFYYYQTVAGLFMWGTLSHERTGLSFIIAGDSPANLFSGPSPVGLNENILLSRANSSEKEIPSILSGNEISIV